MDDLISRQDAIDALDCINGTEEVLRSLPSAQPERPKGHWICVGDGYTDYFKCSECGNLSDYEENFCCDCGSDNRGEQDE